MLAVFPVIFWWLIAFMCVADLAQRLIIWNVQDESLNFSARRDSGFAVCSLSHGVLLVWWGNFASGGCNPALNASGWHVCAHCTRSATMHCYTCPNAYCNSCTKEADFLCLRKGRGLCELCYQIVYMIEHNLSIDSEGVSLFSSYVLILCDLCVCQG